MDSEKSIYTSKQIAPETWMILGDGCTCYLVAGDQKAIMIDTGFAEGNIREYASSLTEKPLREVVNTHGHFDHTALNGQFDLAYMMKEAMPDAVTPYPDLMHRSFILDYPVSYIKDGDVLDLGGRTLEVIHIPSHSVSSVALLDRKARLLFSGDEIMPMAMLHYHQDVPQPSLSQFVRNMERVLKYSAEFDYVCTGHAQELLPAGIVKDLRDVAQDILNGEETKKFEPPKPKPGASHQVEFPFIEHVRILEKNGVKVAFDERFMTKSPYDLRGQEEVA